MEELRPKVEGDDSSGLWFLQAPDDQLLRNSNRTSDRSVSRNKGIHLLPSLQNVFWRKLPDEGGSDV